MTAQPALLENPGLDDATEQAPAPLSAQGISLTLGSRVVLSDVSFSVGEGEVFGILGPNGSGKTSLMRCLSGLMRQDIGAVRLSGELLGDKNRDARAKMGVVFQDPSLDAKLTVQENLELGARLFNVRGNEAKERVADLLKFIELSERADDPCGILSGGLKRRVELARALIGNPSVLLLDEPTTGLDMHAFERTWQRLLALRDSRGMSLLVTTHRADEAAFCDRLAILDRGRIIACDTPQNLLKKVSGDVISIEAERPDALAQQLEEHFELRARVIDDRIEIEVEDAHLLIPRLVEALPTGRLRAVTMRRPSLADAFFHLTGRGLGDAEETP